ncbi:hypothetical protein [Methylobacterium sp. WL9]|uniref:hypothetical protein n=1 Tax=Methylobacterium sp. WL9 TaxID=2603898 RepID=UPI0011C8C434|nr:hypothetical protein [Methylobacterium sp. WL9]TXN24976.1 hypothetical protein FV217_00010 [Methylobacterium sp. WL9]
MDVFQTDALRELLDGMSAEVALADARRDLAAKDGMGPEDAWALGSIARSQCLGLVKLEARLSAAGDMLARLAVVSDADRALAHSAVAASAVCPDP